jgi:Zn finger protein HypA/HybF involved in hydrogenase expression
MEKSIKLKCQNCKLEWTYKGKKKWNPKYKIYVSCPRCKSSVGIKG